MIQSGNVLYTYTKRSIILHLLRIETVPWQHNSVGEKYTCTSIMGLCAANNLMSSSGTVFHKAVFTAKRNELN